jgi:hypothetical protein
MNHRSSTFLAAAIIVFIAIAGFVFIIEGMGVFPSGNWLFDLTEMGLFAFSTVLVSLGIIKGKPVYFFVTLTVVGLFLVVCSSVITVPYTAFETFSQTESFDMTKDIYALEPPYGSPYAENGSSEIFELLPNSTKLFYWADLNFLRGNLSIVQINISSAYTVGYTLLIFRIVGLTRTGATYDVDTIDFEHICGVTSPYDSSWWLDNWVSFYWTLPLGDPVGQYAGFLFQNPSNYTIFFRFNVINFYQNNEATRQVTRNHTLMNPDYFYAGIALIGSATCLEVYSRGTEKRKTGASLLKSNSMKNSNTS